MKNQPLTLVLVVALALNAIAAPILTYWYVQTTRKLNALKYQVSEVNRNQSSLQALAGDAIEYSRKNPAIDPLLQTVGIKPKPGAAPASGKPAGK